MARKPDFSGWATKYGVKCDDGRTIQPGAFKEQDGQKVTLVYQHNHDDLDAVIGHGVLHAKPEGMWMDGYLNDTPRGKTAKALVHSGDLFSLSIWANKLSQTPAKDVVHGVIREVSLVLAGANPGGRIENPVLAHSGETVYDEAIIYSGEYVSHGGDEMNNNDTQTQSEELEHSGEDMNAEEVWNSMSKEQQDLCALLVGQAAGDDDDDDAAEHSAMEEDDHMKSNVFDTASQVSGEELSHSAIQEAFDAINADAQRSSLKDSFMAHSAEYGIENIEYLFPDARKINNTPDFIMRDQGWVTDVMNGTHHTPFSRVKSIHADITADEARALGYIKGNLKKEEVFSLLKRTTEPQTIYKKQKLDRDDIVDITDFDVVAWIKTEMRMMLNEEIARAILIGDGRASDSSDKIKEDRIRPIAKDTQANLYAMRYTVQYAASATEDDIAKAFIRQAIRSRKDYKGSGNPVLFTTEDMLTTMLLLEDGIGHSLYKTEAELATKLRVRKIVTVPVMEGYTIDEETSAKITKYPLFGIIVNLSDYNVGADKGGSVNMFDDFDIDYNQYKYLIETRISGALIKPKSAIVITGQGVDYPVTD